MKNNKTQNLTRTDKRNDKVHEIMVLWTTVCDLLSTSLQNRITKSESCIETSLQVIPSGLKNKCSDTTIHNHIHASKLYLHSQLNYYSNRMKLKLPSPHTQNDDQSS